jgi:hypothetical protein
MARGYSSRGRKPCREPRRPSGRASGPLNALMDYRGGHCHGSASPARYFPYRTAGGRAYSQTQSRRAPKASELQCRMHREARPSRVATLRNRSSAASPGFSSGVDNEDDPKGVRLDDHDPVTHEKIIVSAPSGINLHYPRRQRHNAPWWRRAMPRPTLLSTIKGRATWFRCQPRNEEPVWCCAPC